MNVMDEDQINLSNRYEVFQENNPHFLEKNEGINSNEIQFK